MDDFSWQDFENSLNLKFRYKNHGWQNIRGCVQEIDKRRLSRGVSMIGWFQERGLGSYTWHWTREAGMSPVMECHV